MKSENSVISFGSNLFERFAVVRFLLVALLLLGMVGGASAIELSLINDVGDGSVDGINYGEAFGRYEANNVHSSQEFQSNKDIEADSLSINVGYVFDSANTFSSNIDVYISQGGTDTTWKEGTLVKNNWNPSLTTGVKSFSFDKNYSIYGGNTYEIEFYTASSSCSGSYCYFRIDADSSPSNIKYTSVGAGGTKTKSKYNDIKFFGIVANKDPKFDSSSISPEPPLIGENVSYSASVSDSDGSISYTNLSLSYGGSQVVSDAQRTGTNSPAWNNIFTPNSGNKWLNATLETVDDAGATTTQEINRYIENQPPSVNVSASPSTWQKNDEVDVTVNASDPDYNISWINTSTSQDGTQLNSSSNSYSQSSVDKLFQNFFTVSNTGNYSVRVDVEDSIGAVTTKYINQSVPDTYPPNSQLNISGSTFSTDSLPIKITAVDDDSMVESLSYRVDGGAWQTVQNDTADVTITGFGSHTLEYNATDNRGNVESTNTKNMELVDLVADFTFTPTTPVSGESVSFDAASSTGNITSYDWDFNDDGSFDTSGETASFTFTSTGTKLVTLQLTSGDGATDSITKNVEVAPNSTKGLVKSCPAEPFCHNSSNPRTLSGSFTAEDPDQVYTWTVNATGSAGDYTFFSFFNSTASRIAEKFTGTTTISITDPTINSAPTADFTVSLTDLSVSTDASASSDSDGTISSYEWDWTNDGTFDSTGQTASHTYPSNGTYTIKLRVTDNDGATSTLTKTVSVSESTSGDGGGSSGGDSGVNETTVSVDGSTATLLAPHSGARYSKSTFTINEGGSNTILINGNEHTFGLDNIVSGTEAQIILDGVSQSWKEEETETIEGLDVSLVDVTQKGSGGTVSFTIANAVDLNEPVAWYAYNYTINNSGSVELQLREAGPGNTWNTIDSNTVTSTVDNQYVNFTQNLEAGIYEARLRLNASGNSSISNVNGFYSGEVPRLEITNPTEAEQIKQPRTPRKNIPLDYEYELRTWSNVTDSGQVYIDSNGNKHSVLVSRSVETVSEDSWFESLTKLVTGLSVDEVYSSGYSWFYPTEPDVYQIDTVMQVNGGFGDYTGYSNVTVNDSTGSEKKVYSYGRNVEIVPQSTNDFINNNKQSEVVNTGERTFNTTYSVDQDGDGVAENVTVGTLVTGLDTPEDGGTVTVSSLDDGKVDFHFFAMNINGTALLNKTLVLEDVNKNETVYRERLAPGKNEYSIDVNGSQVGGWNQTEFQYSIEYFEPGTNNVSLYNSAQDNISNTFTVQRAGLKDLASRLLDPIIDAFTTIYDVSSEYAGFIVALIATVGWYAASKARELDFIAKAGAGTIFGVAWWYGLIPANIQALVLGIVALIVTIKLWRGEVTL